MSASLDTVLFLTEDLARLSVRIAGVSKHLELWKDGEIPTGEKLRGSAILQTSSEGHGLVFTAKNNFYLEGWSQKTSDSPNSGNSIDCIHES